MSPRGGSARPRRRAPFDGSAVGGTAGQDEAEVLPAPRPGDAPPPPVEPGPRPGGAPALRCDAAGRHPFEGDPRGVLRRAIRRAGRGGLSSRGRRGGRVLPARRRAAPRSRRERPAPRPRRRCAGDGGGAGGDGDRRGLLSSGSGTGSAGDRAPRPPDALAARTSSPRWGRCARDRGRGARRAGDLHAEARSSARTGPGSTFTTRSCGEDANAFADPEALDGLSAVLRSFVGGLLGHARGFAAITNPLVNSYKRLVPGYAAPVDGAWSLHEAISAGPDPPVRGEKTRAARSGSPTPPRTPTWRSRCSSRPGWTASAREADPGAPDREADWRR